MTLSAGTKLGPYEILAPIGSGGMGEVYRARDARLGREVAIKVLPDELSDDPRALARFESEARAVAALSHPNILALFDVGESGGIHYAVSELLHGQTLRLALAEGALPVRLALDVAIQIAEALGAAHENGFVHRDVKPENVFLASGARVKLLDFGLAQDDGTPGDAADPLPTTATGPSRPGNAAGTVAYMSPEQASGGPVDFRSDQFSLGIVLYEMLAGRRPFVGATAAEVSAAIVQKEPPPLEAVAPRVPAGVGWLVERLLEKDPDARYASTLDLAQELSSLRTHLSLPPPASSLPVGSSSRRARLALGAVALALAAAAPFAVLFLEERHRPRPTPGRFDIRLPEGTFLVPHQTSLALSPDGQLLVFSAFAWKVPYEEEAAPQLFFRPLQALESRPIPGTEGGVQPVFSPDGRHVAFAAENGGVLSLRRVGVDGGAVQTICDCDARYGIAWTPGGSILFASQLGPLQRVPAGGGTPEPATVLDAAEGEASHRLPHLLPDGRTLLYTAVRWRVIGGGMWKRARIFAAPLGGRTRTLLVEGASDGRWAAGVLLFARDGSLLAAPFDPGTLRTPGKPVLLIQGLRHSISTGNSRTETGASHLALSSGGLLAWGPGTVAPPLARTKVWVDASGNETPLEGGALAGPVTSGRISADGGRVLLSYNYPFLQSEVVDLARRSRRQATFDVTPAWPIWGPGPGAVTFASDHEGPMALYTRRLEAGPDDVEKLWQPRDGGTLALGSWSRDGRTLAFLRLSPATRFDIWLLEEGKQPRPFVATRFQDLHPDISPDGRWLLYSSNGSGRFEVVARPLAGEGGTLTVSAGEGAEPLWSRDGRSVYYWQPVEGRPRVRALFRVGVTRTEDSLSFGVPERLFEGRYLSTWPGHSWDVAPDGRFLLTKPPGAADLRAWWGSVLSDRIVVDTAGLASLLARARSEP